MRGTSLFLCTTLLLCAAPPASAKLYKWVDSQGVTNYSNRPPVGVPGAAVLPSASEHVTLYKPDAELTREVQAFRESSAKAVARAGRLPPNESQRIAAAQARKATRLRYEQCLENDGVDCREAGIAAESYRPLDDAPRP